MQVSVENLVRFIVANVQTHTHDRNYPSNIGTEYIYSTRAQTTPTTAQHQQTTNKKAMYVKKDKHRNDAYDPIEQANKHM